MNTRKSLLYFIETHFQHYLAKRRLGTPGTMREVKCIPPPPPPSPTYTETAVYIMVETVLERASKEYLGQDE